MLSSPHLQANQKSAQTYDQWWNPCQCMHIFMHVTYTNVKRHIQSRRGVWGFIREGGREGGKECQRHEKCPTFSQSLKSVRMMLVGTQEWINSIWRDDEFWPLRVRWGGSSRDMTLRAVWVSEWHEHVHVDKDFRCLFGTQRQGGYVHIGVTNATFAVKLWHGSRGGGAET